MMELLIRFDSATCARLTPEQLSQLSNLELLQVVRALEPSSSDRPGIEHDHGQYLSRQELERLVCLAQRFYLRRCSTPAE